MDGADATVVLEHAIVADFGLVQGLAAATGTATSSSARRPATSTRRPRRRGGSPSPRSSTSSSPGQLDPDAVHLPGIFVQRVLALTPEQARDKRIEKRTVTPAAAGTGADGEV